jgi:hypothetical protein
VPVVKYAGKKLVDVLVDSLRELDRYYVAAQATDKVQAAILVYAPED